jgi:hypothetical protein
MSMVLATDKPDRGLFAIVAAVSLFTLPLMQSLTVQVGFPLKIYEVMLLGAAMILPFFGRLVFPQSAVPMAKITVYWMLLVSVLLVSKLVFPPPTMSSLGVEGRFGAGGDGITKLVYLWLNLLGFLIFSTQARRDESFFINCWLWGAAFSASYEFYLIACNLMGIVAPPMLPNSKGVIFGFGGHLFQRAATFTEGNYSGLYFVLSFLLAMHAGYRRFAVIMVMAVITSFSTPAFIVLCGIAADFAWRYFSKMRSTTKFFLSPLLLAMTLLLGAGVAVTTVFQAAVINKLTAAESTSDAYSRVERLRAAQGAWQMFSDNPLTGVGVAQFGYNIQYYQPTSVTGKQIPNVVYLEFLSEYGILAFAIFMYSVWLTFRRTDAKGERYLRIAVFSMLFYFAAFPSISVMYLWAFLALVFGRARGPYAASFAESRSTGGVT